MKPGPRIHWPRNHTETSAKTFRPRNHTETHGIKFKNISATETHGNTRNQEHGRYGDGITQKIETERKV